MTEPGTIDPARGDALLEEFVSLPSDERPSWLDAADARTPGIKPLLLATIERHLPSRVQATVEAADAMMAACRGSGDLVSSARAARLLSHALAYAGRLAEAVSAADDAARDARNAGSAVDAARADAAAMHPLTKLGRAADAAERGERARDALRACGEPALAARVEFNLANVLRLVGRAGESLEALDRASAALGGAPAVQAQVESSRGEALLALGRMSEAVAAFERCIGLLGSSGQAPGFALALAEGNLADVHARAGNATEALAGFERARRGFSSEATRGHVARIDVEEAELVEAIGAPDDALESARRAVPGLDATGHAWEVARALSVVARALRSLGRHADAADAAGTAAARWSALGNASRADELSLVAAAALRSLGRSAEARQAVERAMRSEDRVVAVRALLEAARQFESEGRRDESRPALDRAVDAAEALGVRPMVADALEARAAHAFADGRDEDAIRDARQAFEIAESVRSSLQAERLRGAALGRRRIASDVLVRALLRRGDVDGAFEAAERARNRAVLDVLDGAVQASDAIDPSRQRELEARLNRLYAELASPSRPGERRADLDAWRTDVRAIERELDASRTVAGGEGSSVSPASEVRGALRPGEVLVEHCVALDRVVAFVAAPDRPAEAVDLCGCDELSKAAERLGFLVRRPAIEGDDARARRLDAELDRAIALLHRLLVAPMPTHALAADRWVCAPHRITHGIPIHALGPAGADAWKPVSYVPSASTFVRRRASHHAMRPGAATLVAACPDAFAPDMAEEASCVADAVARSGGRAEVLLGEAACADALRARSADAAVVHIATHGRFDPVHPRASGLRMADRWLSARELAGLPLEGALVVLSGCDTGRVAIERGDEVAGILRALLEAKVGTAVATLWPAHDRTSTGLMAALHERLARSRESGNLADPSVLLNLLARDAATRGIPARYWAPFIALAS